MKTFRRNCNYLALLDQEINIANGRKYESYLDHDSLLHIFKEAGFKLCNFQTDSSLMTTAYIIRKEPSQKKDPVFVDVDDVKEFTWIEPLQKIIEDRLNEPDWKTIWLTNTKVRNNGRKSESIFRTYSKSNYRSRRLGLVLCGRKSEGESLPLPHRHEREEGDQKRSSRSSSGRRANQEGHRLGSARQQLQRWSLRVAQTLRRQRRYLKSKRWENKKT